MTNRLVLLVGAAAIVVVAGIVLFSRSPSPPAASADARIAAPPPAPALAAPSNTAVKGIAAPPPIASEDPPAAYRAYLLTEASAFAEALGVARKASSAGDTTGATAAIVEARAHYQRLSPIMPLLSSPKPPNLGSLYASIGDLGDVPRGIVLAGLVGASGDVKNRVAALSLSPLDILGGAASRLDQLPAADDANPEDMTATVEGIRKAVSLYLPAIGQADRGLADRLVADGNTLQSAVATAPDRNAVRTPAGALAADIKAASRALGLGN